VTEQPNRAHLKLRRALLVAGVGWWTTPAAALSLHLGTEQRVRKVRSTATRAAPRQEMRVSVASICATPTARWCSGRAPPGEPHLRLRPEQHHRQAGRENLIYQELLDNVVGQIFRQLRARTSRPGA
jgi:hypothetical protein